ncbi:LacI family DNA-binding transcriptional regulator [Parafrankia sp. FMc6]|uniref:LacI family DNA-binding transcriptional regulator n=1 Tax=Parafrankia soli TaxID=2599596 RepID=UPI0034D4723E
MSEATTTRRTTAEDVAREAGVSRATVSFVLNDTPGQTIPEGTRLRVRGAAERLGYRPNRAARALASGRSRIVLLVLPDWPIEYLLRDYLDEASLVLGRAGYALVPYTHQPGNQAPPLWETLSPDLVLGPIPFSPTDIAAMHASGVRKIYPDPGQGSLPDISLTISAGPNLQVDHLHTRGHRRLVYAAFTDPRTTGLATARHRAARTRAQALGLTPPDLATIDYRDDSVDHMVRRWHDTAITGVIAYNDEVAATVTGAAVRLGLRLPEDLAVVGHDDTPIATMFAPRLSTVRFDTSTLGQRFAEFALHLLDGRPLTADEPLPGPALVHRETS